MSATFGKWESHGKENEPSDYPHTPSVRNNCCCGGGRICPSHGDTTPEERKPDTMTPTQPSATHGVTPRTDEQTGYTGGRYTMMYNGNGTDCVVPADFARTLERELLAALTELAAVKAECERLRALNDNAGSAMQWAKEELAAAKAELVRFKESTWEHDEFNRKHAVARSIERDNDKDELARLRAELANQKVQNNHNWQFQEISEEALKRAERAELALANAQCPHIISTNEVTHYCALAESSVAKLTAERDALEQNLQQLLMMLRKSIVWVDVLECYRWSICGPTGDKSISLERAIAVAMKGTP